MPRTGERGGPQTKARIREVANQLFIDRGFDAVTVAEVAREAGVSSVTVFKHFPVKEDLFLDRAGDAAGLLRAAVRDRAPGTDVLTSLHATVFGVFEAREPLSGVDERSVPFFRTVAASPVLIARARQIAAGLQGILTGELERDPGFHDDAALLGAFLISGYSTVLVETARRLIAGQPWPEVIDDHRTRLERLFGALRTGFSPAPDGR